MNLLFKFYPAKNFLKRVLSPSQILGFSRSRAMSQIFVSIKFPDATDMSVQDDILSSTDLEKVGPFYVLA